MKISKNKKYKTRSGLPVRIYAVDGGEQFPIHGAVLNRREKRWDLESWRRDGVYFVGENNPWDLVEIKPKKKDEF